MRIVSWIVIGLSLTSCGSAPQPEREAVNISTSDAISADLAATRNNYDEKEGRTYLYTTAVSDEDKAKGRAVGDVLMYQYLGKEGGKHVLTQVGDNGAVISRSECSDPCRIIKSESHGVTNRIPYNTGSVIGAAFEDALNGRLEVFSKSVKKPDKQSAAQSRIPAIYLGEWNDDLAACGTGNNPAALTISSTKLDFYESEGAVRTVEITSERDATVFLTMTGEGETWKTKFRLLLSQSGNELTIDDFTRYRCR